MPETPQLPEQTRVQLIFGIQERVWRFFHTLLPASNVKNVTIKRSLQNQTKWQGTKELHCTTEHQTDV
jgi:hypothetical protein